MIDLTEDFADLLEFAANVAIVIRLGSAYTSAQSVNRPTEIDLMWLADSLQNLSMLTRAVRQQKLSHVVEAANLLRTSFEAYRDEDVIENSRLKSSPSKTFKKYEDYFRIEDAIQILERIKTKALAKLKESGKV